MAFLMGVVYLPFKNLKFNIYIYLYKTQAKHKKDIVVELYLSYLAVFTAAETKI